MVVTKKNEKGILRIEYESVGRFPTIHFYPLTKSGTVSNRRSYPYAVGEEDLNLFEPVNAEDIYSATYGPGTKQWWIYDSKNDTFIDPPTDVLDKINANGDYSTADGMDAMRDKLEDICNNELPSWLFEKAYIYPAEETEI